MPACRTSQGRFTRCSASSRQAGASSGRKPARTWPEKGYAEIGYTTTFDWSGRYVPALTILPVRHFNRKTREFELVNVYNDDTPVTVAEEAVERSSRAAFFAQKKAGPPKPKADAEARARAMAGRSSGSIDTRDRKKARGYWDRLPESEKRRLSAALAQGIDWREWFSEKPTAAFLDELDQVRLRPDGATASPSGRVVWCNGRCKA